MSPSGITTDGTNLYVADYGNNNIRKVVLATGAVTTLAGSGTWGYGDGVGAAAQFRHPLSVTTDGTNLYVTDIGNACIRKVEIATGTVTTLAGSAGGTGTTDGLGSAATFSAPATITCDGTNLFVMDWDSQRIRRVVIATGAVTTLPQPFYTVTFLTNDGGALYATTNDQQIVTIR